MNTGTIEYTGGSTSSNMPFTLTTNGAGAFQIDKATTNLTLSAGSFGGGGNGAITGSGDLYKTGPGTLTLTNQATYTGQTFVNGGTLVTNFNLSGSGAFSTNNLILNGGNLVINGSYYTGSPVSSTQFVASLTAGSGVNTIVINPNGGDNTALLIGSGAISSGVVHFDTSLGGNASANLGTSTNAFVQYASAPTLNNGILSPGYTITDTANTGYATIDNSNPNVFNNVVPLTTSNVGVALTATNSSSTNPSASTTNFITTPATDYVGNQLTLSGGPYNVNTLTVNTGSGSNTLDLGGGTMNITANSVLSTGTGTLTIQNGAVNLPASAPFIAYNYGSSTLNFTAPVSGGSSLIQAGPGTLILSNNNAFNQNITISGNLVYNTNGNVTIGNTINGNGSLTYSGTGQMTLTGNNNSTLAGGITITGGGTLETAQGVNDTNLGAGLKLTLANGTWVEPASNNGSNANIVLGTGGGTWVMPNVDFVFNGTITGNNPLTLSGSDFLSGTGDVQISTLTVAANTRLLPFNNTILSGTSSFVVESGGKLDVGGGDFDFTSKTLTFEPGSYFGQRNSNVTVNTLTTSFPTTGTMHLQTDDTPTTQSITINGNWQTLTGNLTITIGGINNSPANDSKGNVILNGGFSGPYGVTFAGPNTFILSTPYTANGGTGTTSSYGGATNITGGTLQTTYANTLPSTTPMNISAGGTFDLAGTRQSIGSLQGAGTVTSSTGGGTLTVGNDNSSPAPFSGLISGTGLALSKVGTGTLTLSNGNNSYTGGTSVTGGTLMVTNATGSATGSGPVNVDQSGVLAGSGHVTGLVTAGGGTVYPSGGGANATLTVGGLTMDNTATFEIKIGSGFLTPPTAGTNYDQVASTANVTLGNAQLVLNDASYYQTTGDMLDILHVSNGSSISGFLDYNHMQLNNNSDFFDVNGKLYKITYTATDVILTSVPEPGSLVLGVLAALGTFGLVRRMRRQRTAA